MKRDKEEIKQNWKRGIAIYRDQKRETEGREKHNNADRKDEEL